VSTVVLVENSSRAEPMPMVTRSNPSCTVRTLRHAGVIQEQGRYRRLPDRRGGVTGRMVAVVG
jgi:hypothetical protein